MKKRTLTRSLIAIGLLVLVGVVGAQTYYTHEQAKRVADDDSAGMTEQLQVSPQDATRDPWIAMHQEMMRMRAEMDQLFGHSQGMQQMSANGILQNQGKVSLEDQGDNYLIKADIPGAKESDIQVNLNGRLLSISAQTQGSQEQKNDSGQVVHEESYASSFQRAFTLPNPVDASGMHSQFQNGVLTVSVPKATS